MNKKGEENTLVLKNLIEFLLAIAVIAMILIIGITIFHTYFGKQDDMQAKGTLDRITQMLYEKNSTGDSGKILLQAPEKWYVVSFNASYDKNGDFEKPNSFFGKNTLCICQKGSFKKTCFAEICRQISLPAMKEGKPLMIAIRPMDLFIMNAKDYFEFSDKTIEAKELSEKEKTELSWDVSKVEEKYGSSMDEIAAKYYPEVKVYFNSADDFKEFIEAIISVESSGVSDAKSECGAVGMMQLMPRTARDMGLKVPDYAEICNKGKWNACIEPYKMCYYSFECNKITPENCKESEDERFDAMKNTDAGTKYIAKLINQLKNIQLALAAYNAGIGNVLDDCKPLADITSCPFDYAGRKYSDTIMGRYDL